MDLRIRNGPSLRRAFGKDITNLERRPKTNSISEKPTLIADFRNKSRSFEKRTPELKDPITDYETDILDYMLEIQVKSYLKQVKERK